MSPNKSESHQAMRERCILKLRVQPKASKNLVEGCRGDTVRVRVTAPPENGKANAAVVALLADALDVNRSQLTIIKGLRSKNKTVEVESLTLEEAVRRLGCAAK